jgi:predicted GIY-YIG superfamily endonuclease
MRICDEDLDIETILADGDDALTSAMRAVRSKRAGAVPVDTDVYVSGYAAAAILMTMHDHADYDGFSIEEPLAGIVDSLYFISGMLDRFANSAEAHPEHFAKPIFEPTQISQDEAAKHAASYAKTLRSMSSAISGARTLAEAIPFASYDRSGERSVECPTNGQRTAIYRWYDADGMLLYIGITGAFATRQSSHIKRSSWAKFAAKSRVEWIDGRCDAELLEIEAIKAEQPLFNYQHNDTPDARKRLVEYLVAKDCLDLLRPCVSRG